MTTEREVDSRGNCSKCGGTHYGSYYMCPIVSGGEDRSPHAAQAPETITAGGAEAITPAAPPSSKTSGDFWRDLLTSALDPRMSNDCLGIHLRAGLEHLRTVTRTAPEIPAGPNPNDTPPFTVERYGSFGAAMCAENRWMHREIERLTPFKEQVSHLERRLRQLTEEFNVYRLSHETTSERWIVWYADPDRKPEHFSGDGAEQAARHRWNEQRQAWTCWLFRSDGNTEKTSSNYDQDYTAAELAALCRTKDKHIERLESKRQQSVTLNGYQLLETLDFIAPDRGRQNGGRDQLEDDVSIEWSDDGHSGRGYYACVTEYPEEGSILLSGTPPEPSKKTDSEPCDSCESPTVCLYQGRRCAEKTEVGRNHDPSGADRSGLRPDLRAQDQKLSEKADGLHQGDVDATKRDYPARRAERQQLCEDCPPIGYVTDKTRCAPCPRRASTAQNGRTE
jgi:hypothetical protein